MGSLPINAIKYNHGNLDGDWAPQIQLMTVAPDRKLSKLPLTRYPVARFELICVFQSADFGFFQNMIIRGQIFRVYKIDCVIVIEKQSR